MMSNNTWAKTKTGMHRLWGLLFDTCNSHHNITLCLKKSKNKTKHQIFFIIIWVNKDRFSKC